jgi:hypothetical protein
MAERELRRMVVDLAALLPEDREAVLGELDAPQRRVLEDMLRAFNGEALAAEAVAPDAVAGCDASKFSPWLVERMAETSAAATTSDVRKALHDCAVALYPRTERERNPGLLSRFAAVIGGRP